MRNIPSSVYTKDYYLKDCLGHEEFNKYKGEKLSSEVEKLLYLIDFSPNMRVLDLGCGRGDAVFFLASKGIQSDGVDYSKEGIDIAKKTLALKSKDVQKKSAFFVMDAKKLRFKKNTYDVVIAFDVFEHLYPEELEEVMGQIKRVLKPQGILLVHTEANKIYLNITHKWYTYPINAILIFFNKLLTGKLYPGLPKDPRNDLHKKQHVNEPTYYYLRGLFKRHHFTGEIIPKVSMVKNVFSWKDMLYNSIVLLHPLSSFYPLNLFFAYDYICIMKNQK